MEDDENTVSPGPESCRSAFELGFRAWSSDSERVSCETHSEIREGLRGIDDAFPSHPAFPSGLNLAKSSGRWKATGKSFWDGTGGLTSPDLSSSGCAPGLPGMPPQKHSFPVTKSRPARLELSDSSQSGRFCFPGDKDDHITTLVLAWAYILSARWTELIPGTNNVQYREVTAESSKDGSSTVTVPIEATSGEAVRWWQAVLGGSVQGWLATADADGKTLFSPWSIRLSSSSAGLIPLFLGRTPARADAPDSATALHYLSEYVTMYGVADQSRAALSAVLCLPFATRWSSRVTLPAPSITTRVPTSQHDKASTQISLAQVDKLMVLSCNAQGLEALLLSSFFNPAIPCNLVSPFLQGTFAALDPISQDPLLLIHTLMRRSPKVGFLWAGAAILGSHTPLLDHARHGALEIELLSAVWTGTIQTFMQLPVSTTTPGRIRREDECRLAYLASEEYQGHIPLYPWKPFGTVDFEDAELDVQIHAGCHGHGLRYRGWAWDCLEDGRPISIMHEHQTLHETEQRPAHLPHPSVEVPYDKLDLDDDSASSTATLNMFMWLRRAGFAASEQHIRRHEWLCEAFDNDEEEAYESWPEDDDDAVCARKKRAKSASDTARPKLGGWLASTQTRRDSL